MKYWNVLIVKNRFLKKIDFLARFLAPGLILAFASPKYAMGASRHGNSCGKRIPYGIRMIPY